MRVIHAEGDAFQRGLVVGRAFAEDIRSSVAFNLSYFERRGLGRQALVDAAAPFKAAAEAAFPRAIQTLRGMAQGAGVPLSDLFVPNAFEELEPIAESGDGAPAARNEHCSDVSVVGPGVTLLGHNENWSIGDADGVGVVISIPSEPDEVAFASPTIATFLPAVGLNAHGGAVGVMSLSASDDGVGVPRVFLSHHALASADRADAIRRCSVPDRAGGYGYSFAFRGGDTFTIETSAAGLAILDGPGVHTNHYIDPDLAETAEPASPRSLSRHDRLVELAAQRRPRTPEDVMAMLADHDSTPAAVCTHPDPEEGDEGHGVLFSMVCDLEARRMWVAPGNPCTVPYEAIDLAGVV